ncbi:MAG: isoleucine--tRNA ligase [Chitinophagaceae bacterium]|nr:isoleucine--tRNA ligase [Chitinophagaceae bacterium]
MNKYPEFKQLNLPEIDQEILQFWSDQQIFEQSVATRKGKTPFVFYEGPPSANGHPGIHHVISRTIKDLFCRYRTLKGYEVKRKAGWDTHGLPVELAVEKMLGIRKDDIGKKISVAEYNSICRQEVLKYKDVWDHLTRKMGYWVDLEHPYVTFENYYIESVWWLLKQFHTKGYLYEGYAIQPYSPAAGTGLSSHELNQPGTYKDIRDTSVIAQFSIIPGSLDKSKIPSFLIDAAAEGNCFLLAWTTTPWTLPSNCALAVGEKISYALVKTYNPYTYRQVNLILAKDLVPKYFSHGDTEAALKLSDYKPGDKVIPFEMLGEVSGKQLEGIKYEQLMPYVQPEGNAFMVVTGDFVTTEDGTGIVHIAPSFGADDFRIAKKYGIPALTLVDKQGRFVPEVTDYAGEFVKEQYLSEEEKEQEKKKQGREKYLSVDERIAIRLKEQNKAFKVEKFEHSYPHCWRTDKPILYYPLDSWFIKSTAARDRLIELNKTINWKPEATGTGRFGNWLENLQDWNLSRSRFWGTPLPIWKTEDGTEEICIGSLEELSAEIDKSVKAGFMQSNPVISTKETIAGSFHKTDASGKSLDLHKPFVDELLLVSPGGKLMRRVPDLIDVWFDSGAMPYAQLHYPFENKEALGENFPADYIAEGVDQTRGWFFTLHVIAVMLFDSVAFKNVIANGLVLDKYGNKMSKRLGNIVEPFETLDQFGVDATRWYLISNSQPWDNLKFDLNGIDEVRRKLFGTLFNTYAFFILYANIDGFAYREEEVAMEKRQEIDRWIISLLNSLVKEVDESLADYEPTKAARAVQTFVDEHLSNWYVRLSRRRFWKGEYEEDKIAAYQTLYQCLETLTQLMSPISPFFSDWLFRNLNGVTGRKKEVSVHLTDFPAYNPQLINPLLEERMRLAQEISSMVLSLRKKVNIKVRQPLSRIMIPYSSEPIREQLLLVRDLILSEVNVKELDFVTDTSGLVTKRVKANFKLLGARLGKRMKIVNEELLKLEQDQIQLLELEGFLELVIDNEAVVINLNEVEVISEDIPGWQVANQGELTVALDVTITETLQEEGNARELVNRIQKMRKDLGYNVTDRIDVFIEKSETINLSVINFKNYICAEILAESLELVDSLSGAETLTVNDLPVKVIIKQKK